MLDTHADFRRSPSSPHQCLHYADDGARCRATAMHNHYMCYAHRTDSVPPVIENDPFDLPNLDTYDAIQHAFGQVASRLACNHIDLGRAQLLTTLIRAASRNLRDRAQAHRTALRAAQFAASSQNPVILSEGTPEGSAVVEGPAVVLSPSSDNGQRTSDNASETSDNAASTLDNAGPIPPRDYTADESDYLFFNIIQGNTRYRRPEEVSDQDIDDYLAFYRALYPGTPTDATVCTDTNSLT